MPTDEVDVDIIDCAECGLPVKTLWARDGNKGLLPSEDYILIADWIFHPLCWDKLVERADSCPSI